MSIQEYDDRNPFIIYNGQWAVGDSSSSDTEKGFYHQQTWTLSEVDGACAEIRWNGGDITVWGSRRFNHGFYSISLDSSPKIYFDGFSNPSDYSTPLISTFADNSKSYKPLVGQKDGNHQIRLCNEVNYNARSGRKYFDVDKIQIRGNLIDARNPPKAPNAAPAPASAQTPTPSQLQPSPSTSPNTQNAQPENDSPPAAPQAANPVTSTRTQTTTSTLSSSTTSASSSSSSTSTSVTDVSPLKVVATSPSRSGNPSTTDDGDASGGIIIATGTDTSPRLGRILVACISADNSNSLPGQGYTISSSSTVSSPPIFLIFWAILTIIMLRLHTSRGF